MAAHIKDPLPTGIGAVLVYTGDNLDAIIALVGIANVRYTLGYLYVGGVIINPGDAVCMTDDEPPVLAAKMTAQQIVETELISDIVVYDTENVGEIIALAGSQNVEVKVSGLYLKGVAIAEDDGVAKMGGDVFKVPAASIGEPGGGGDKWVPVDVDP